MTNLITRTARTQGVQHAMAIVSTRLPETGRANRTQYTEHQTTRHGLFAEGMRANVHYLPPVCATGWAGVDATGSPNSSTVVPADSGTGLGLAGTTDGSMGRLAGCPYAGVASSSIPSNNCEREQERGGTRLQQVTESEHPCSKVEDGDTPVPFTLDRTSRWHYMEGASASGVVITT